MSPLFPQSIQHTLVFVLAWACYLPGIASSTTDSVVNVHHLGVYGDGATDQHEAIQKILDEHKQVFFPPGRYLISQSLVLRSNQQLSGSDSSVFAFHQAVEVTNDLAFLTVNSQHNLRLTNLTFYRKDEPKQATYAVDACNVQQLTIERVVAYNCGIVKVAQCESHNYATIPDALSSDQFREVGNTQVTVTNCRGTGSQGSVAQHGAGVLIAYTDNWEITHSSFTRYSHGIQWWGGDSHPQRNGKLTNVRKCRNGMVSDVQVTHVRGGGIWGSMGENITVENCRVAHCGDVGIDFEGCFRSQARYNTVNDCKNEAIAIFHFNQDILFANNQLIQSDPQRAHACIYNSAQTQDNGKVTFTDNVFVTTQGVGIIRQQGPSRRIVFTKNSLHNVVLDFCFNNNQYVQIKDNTFTITRPVAQSFIIRAGCTNNQGVLTIENNQILNVAKQQKDLYAISVVQADYNSSPTNRLTNNHIAGISRRFSIEWAGGNPVFRAETYIESTQPLADSAIRVIDSGKQTSRLFVNGKKRRP